jgi:hypothetical protein
LNPPSAAAATYSAAIKSISHFGCELFLYACKSKKQQMAAGAALAAKRGKRSVSSLKGASRGMYKSMNKAELRRMAKTKRKKLPKKKRR